MPFPSVVGEIDNFIRVAYSDAISHTSQFRKSKLEDSIEWEPIRGDSMYFDLYGPSDGTGTGEGGESGLPTEITGRHAENAVDWELQRTRRRIKPQWWKYVEYFAEQDVIRTLKALQPDSEFMRTVMGMFEKRKDNLIATAFDSAAFGGDDGDTSIPFPGGQTIPHGEAGLTINKILDATSLLEANDAAGEAEGVPWFIAMRPVDFHRLLKASDSDSRIASADYAELKALQSRKIENFLGLNWRRSTVIPQAGGGTAFLGTDDAYAYVYTKRALKGGNNGGIRARFAVIPHRQYSLQVYHDSLLTCTRMHETEVVRIELKNT